ncbi:hypothetical protein KL86DPRO_20177 [uncultured delta proteobacterium]|uniref:Uncharacterized protein n=1 Tax=uncultured delta proteobacterium TaxID=34034 RepID=A0A212JW81_9DELT|nr:hypothetical protein KL86DPRO_20177 [uncultured delta proteobacterium]
MARPSQVSRLGSRLRLAVMLRQRTNFVPVTDERARSLHEIGTLPCPTASLSRDRVGVCGDRTRPAAPRLESS